MTNDILNVPHRHILFTIPEELRPFFFYDRELLSKLASAVNKTLEYQFHNIYKRNKRKIKVPKSSPDYFTNSDIVHYGLITVIHTFGRDLKWNPHIHALVSLGGFTKNFTFKKLDYFHVLSIAEYKITHYDNEKVTFFFNDLADDKKKKYVTMDIDKFVQQILIHLSPKNFKMINRFGFYERNITAKLRNIVKKYKKTLSKSEYSFYVKQSIDTFDVNPFMFPYYKIMMDMQEIYVSSGWYGQTIHKIYF